MPNRWLVTESTELHYINHSANMGRRCATLWYYVLLMAYRDAVFGYGKPRYRRARKQQARRWLCSCSERPYSARWVSEMTLTTELLDGLVRALAYPRTAQSRRVRREVFKLCGGGR